MDNKTPQKDNRTASQKITDLESAVVALFQTNENITRDLMTIKEALKLLGNKADSIVKAAATPEGINDDVINRIMIENNVADLAQRVQTMVERGLLAPQEQIANDSFVVGQELTDTDEVANPRLQFALTALKPELQEKMKGSKAGDTLILEEGKLKFKVLATYQIQQPKVATAPAPQEAPAAPAEAPAPQAAQAPQVGTT